MKMGPITAVQDDSPAAEAGIKPGDQIEQIDGRPPGDPMTLPDRLRRRAGRTVNVTLTRKAHNGPIQLEVPLRRSDRFDLPLMEDNPVAVPSMGIAYHVENEVRQVLPDTPAAKANLKPGDVIVEATLVPPEDATKKYKDFEQKEVSLRFDRGKANWPLFVYAIQETLPGTKVKLTLLDDRAVVLEPYRTTDWYNSNRGFYFQPLRFTQTAGSLGEALALGVGETIESVAQVLRFLRKIGTQVSPRAFGGPVAIAQAAYRSATKGTAKLLLFLTLLSANLAVLNFLPIPLLDGGHMVFLAWEGIRGKPADERIQVALTYLGLIIILSLMIWVLGLDFGLISRQ